MRYSCSLFTLSKFSVVQTPAPFALADFHTFSGVYVALSCAEMPSFVGQIAPGVHQNQEWFETLSKEAGITWLRSSTLRPETAFEEIGGTSSIQRRHTSSDGTSGWPRRTTAKNREANRGYCERRLMTIRTNQPSKPTLQPATTNRPDKYPDSSGWLGNPRCSQKKKPTLAPNSAPPPVKRTNSPVSLRQFIEPRGVV